MNTKLLAGIVGVIVVVLIVAYFLSPKANAPSDLETETQSDADAKMEEGVPTEIEEETEPTEAPEEVEAEKPTPQTVTQGPQTDSPAPAPTPQPSPEPVGKLPYDAVVVFDGGRFIPDLVTIIEGGTVRFINASDKNTKMWIASDNHPIHDRYPMKDEDTCNGNTFDQCEAVDVGEYWDFTFERTGTWGYHNHVAAKYTGDVRVMTVEEFLTRMPNY